MTSEDIQNAEEIVREWFWQPDSWHRKSVVRYYESAPIQPDVLQLVVAYLKQQETDRLFILNKELPLGEKWKATDAWFQTSPSDKWAGTDSTKIRIYQAFKPKADESDGPYTVENGCKYLVTHEFHWDVAAIPTLPASSSGVNYTLQGVTRDKETGLYSCVIEKRETVQQDVELYDSSKSIYETIQRESHIGVKATDLPTTGQAASVGNGLLVERQVSKNGDCTSNVENTVRKEEPVSGAIVNVRRTIRGIWKSITERNQTPAATETDPSVDVGEVAEREKTPGNLRNNKKTTFESAAANGNVDLEDEHQLNALEHTDRKRIILQDGSTDTAEPATLQLEDVAGVTNPLPIATGKMKPEGFNEAEDQAGGAGRKLVTKRIVVNEETGQKERQIVEQTSIPYKKVLRWKDDKTNHEMLVFRNQRTVPTVGTNMKTTDGTSIVATDTNVTLNINNFGLFDGIYHYRNYSTGGGDGSGSTGLTPSRKITIKERYVRPGGRTFIRTYTVTKYFWHADASGAANHYLEGTEYPSLGLRSRCSISGQRGTAEWYGNDLTLVSDEPEGGSSAS